MSHNDTKLTTRKLGELLPKVLAGLQARYNTKPQVLLDAWPSLIGPELAPMTRAVRFFEGVLYVNVKNSTLLSLLNSPHDKLKLLDAIKTKGVSIRNIVFRIG